MTHLSTLSCFSFRSAYDNDFSGTIPNELAKLVNLENLVLAENKLSGTISPEFGMLPKLKLFSAYRRL